MASKTKTHLTWKIGRILALAGAVLLIVQNFLYYVAFFFSEESGFQEILLQILFTLDLIGFLSLGFGFLALGIGSKNLWSGLSGLAFLGWVGVTLSWRIQLDLWDQGWSSSLAVDDFSAFLEVIIDLLLLASFLLGVAFGLFIVAFRPKPLFALFFVLYSGANVIFVLLLITLLLKILVLPAVGVLVFLVLFTIIQKAELVDKDPKKPQFPSSS